MPYRNKRNQTLSAKRSSTPITDLADRKPHQIVGTIEWSLVKERLAVIEGRRGTQCHAKTKIVDKAKKNNGVRSELIDNILNFIDKGGWLQIDDVGGDEDGKWMNPTYYPNMMFESGKVKEEKTGDMFYFPVSSTDNDPKGLALHYNTYNGGENYTIRPNIWRPYTTFNQRKQASRERRREERRVNNIARKDYEMEENDDIEEDYDEVEY